MKSTLLCGNASDSLYLTFKGGCRKDLTYQECYRCTGCGGRFHKDCILEHFKLEETHDWGRQEEREKMEQELLTLRTDLAAAIGHMQGCGHPYGYLVERYPEFGRIKQQQQERGTGGEE